MSLRFFLVPSRIFAPSGFSLCVHIFVCACLCEMRPIRTIMHFID